jgi:hypothetical protein
MAGTWVVEISGYDFSGAAETTLRYALGQGVALTDAAFVPSGLIRWQSPTQRIDVTASGAVKTTADTGEVVISNVPADITEAGPRDALLTWAFQGRTAYLYWLPARNVAPDGVEGAEDLKGKPKPILIGIASNIQGVLVNRQKLIYELHCGEAEVMCVRDGAIPLTAGTQRANVASLQSNALPPGGYDYVSRFRPRAPSCGWAPPRSSGWPSTPGRGISRPPAPMPRSGSGCAPPTATPLRRHRRGLRDAVDGSTAEGSRLVVRRGDQPQGRHRQGHRLAVRLRGAGPGRRLAHRPARRALRLAGARLVLLTPDTDLKADDRPLISLERARPAYQPNGCPPYRVNVRWGFNNTVMSPSDFAGGCASGCATSSPRPGGSRPHRHHDLEPVDRLGQLPERAGADHRHRLSARRRWPDLPHAATGPALLALLSPLTGQYQAGSWPSRATWSCRARRDRRRLSRPGHPAGRSFVVLQSAWLVEGA